MKKSFLLIGCFCISLWVGAQSTDPTLLSSAGEESVGETLVLQWSVGETLTDTRISESIMITEGFQQPNVQVFEFPSHIFGIYPNVKNDQINIEVWPTPVSKYLNIRVQGKTSEGMSAQLYNMTGESLRIYNIDPSAPLKRVDISEEIPGNYVLQFRDAKSHLVKSFIIIKI